MEQEEISKLSHIEIINQMTRLEQNINLDIMRYNRLAREINKRFPFLEEEKEFQEKELKDGKDKRKEFKII